MLTLPGLNHLHGVVATPSGMHNSRNITSIRVLRLNFVWPVFKGNSSQATYVNIYIFYIYI